MTFKRPLHYALFVGAVLITCAGLLESTGGDRSLSLTLLTVGFIPSVAGVVHHELQLRLLPSLVVGTVWTLAVPASLMAPGYLLTTFEPTLAQAVLPTAVRVLTGFMAIVTAMIAIRLGHQIFTRMQMVQAT